MVSGGRIAVLTASLVAGLAVCPAAHADCALPMPERIARVSRPITPVDLVRLRDIGVPDSTFFNMPSRSEEQTSELQSLMRISYAVFCLKKKTTHRYTMH